MLTPSHLRCEYALTPLAIDEPYARLSWQLNSQLRAQTQHAYQIQAASSAELLARGAPDLWDTAKVTSSAQLVPYAGPDLHSGQRVWWRVRLWDGQHHTGPFAEPTWFEMGLLAPEDWRAEWIGWPGGWNGRALYFRRPFAIDRSVKRARAYVAGLGYYELRLNGCKISDHVLDPGTTNYDKRVFYVTYDVTPRLQHGENVLAAIVGHGWYGTPKLLLQLHIDFEDGTSIQILTQDPTWQVGTGPIVRDSIFDGEYYDARLECPGWDKARSQRPTPVEPSLGVETDKTTAVIWMRPHTVDPPGGRLVTQSLEPIRVVDTLSPERVTEPHPGIIVYDLGQNIAGWAQLRVRGRRGQRVVLRFAESLHPDGSVNQENLRSAAATDTYTLRGSRTDPDGDGDIEIWEPRFTYHGFRYIQVEGYPGTPGPGAVTGRLVRSDTASAGAFTCSNELINRIHRMVWWTEATNQHSIPTDCPQRDERMGWLNDLGARTEEALYNFNMARFFAKWVADIHDAQDPATGAITDTAPYRWGSRPADPVSISYLLIPWMLYQHYGDTTTMAAHYDGFKAWVDFLTSQATDHIVSYSYYGDWAPPVEESLDGSAGTSAISRNTPGELISTGYYCYSARLLSQMAEILGCKDDARGYADLAADIATTYHTHFYDPQTGGYGTNNQACNAFSLYMDLVPASRKVRVIGNLVHDVRNLHNGHLTTGNLCTKYILEVLTHSGNVDVAYQIATQETYPGWGYMLANGATTVWERWEHATGSGMNSHNHPMYASIGSWFYKALAGISLDPVEPGFAVIRIRPHIAGDLTHASAALQTVRGPVSSAWRLDGDTLTLEVAVPAGSRAQISIPKPSEAAACRILEGGTIVWDSGPRATVDGITAGEDTGDTITFAVGSGTYAFTRGSA
jgi:alpha-L-rhamnosidase